MSLFSGLWFWGSEYLPNEIPLSLDAIRNWAYKKRILLDEVQIITPGRESALKQFFTSQDGLLVLVHLYYDLDKNLCYLEYPFIPIKSLIKKHAEIELVYWQLIPTATFVNSDRKEYGEVRFGFWFSGSSEEFASVSNAKLICKKFYDLYFQISEVNIVEKECKRETSKINDKIESHTSKILDITVDGSVKAKFLKNSRLFDVEFLMK